MLKNDRWITEQAASGMLEPFQDGLVRHLDPDQRQHPVLSLDVRPMATTCGCRLRSF